MTDLVNAHELYNLGRAHGAVNMARHVLEIALKSADELDAATRVGLLKRALEANQFTPDFPDPLDAHGIDQRPFLVDGILECCGAGPNASRHGASLDRDLAVGTYMRGYVRAALYELALGANTIRATWAARARNGEVSS